MYTNVGLAEIVVVIFGSLLGYAVVLGVMGFSKNGSGPEQEQDFGRMRLSPLLIGCLLGTIVNLLCMALVWWFLYITGLIG
jgi:H+/Cl- antiporter ClcA